MDAAGVTVESGRAGEPTALAGLRVLECGQGLSAPFCTRLLAELGAEVLKVEPCGGDPARAWGPFPDAAPSVEGSATFRAWNGGKHSIELSGERAADARRIAALGADADVLVTNLLPRERAQWGLDLDVLERANPGLVTVLLSPYGETGPLAGERAAQINVCAAGGISVILGEPGRTPLSLPFGVPAQQAAMHGAAAALAALFARRRSGRGQRIDIAETDVLAFYAGGMSLFILGSGGKWKRRGFERHGGIYPSGFYPCKDGFIFLATQTRAQWKGFLRLMGDPEWAQADPALQDGVAIGWQRADEVDVHFIPWLAQHTRRELMEMAARADLVLGPINEAADILAEPHLEARGFWVEEQVGGRRVRLPGMGYRLSRTPWRRGSVPRLGDHDGAGFASHTGDPVTAERERAVAVPRGRRPSRGPLAGLRAIELGFNWAGPLVGQILADMGMEVIKVESAGRLDFMRHWPHARAFFHNANRGKLSVSLDLKTATARDLLRQLAARSDLVFDNFAAGVMSRLGLGYEDLRSVNRDLVVLSMAMAGQEGPLKHLRGFATIATGFAGLEASVGYRDIGSTGFPAIGLGDANAAIQGVLAALAALWHRERGGEGQRIDLSQIEAATALAAELLAEAQLDDVTPHARANEHPRIAPHGIYPAAGDDRWIALAVLDDAGWQALVELLDEPDWAADPALAVASGRRARSEEIDRRLADWTRSQDRDVLVTRLCAHGLAATPVLEIEELASWGPLGARGVATQVESFEEGSGTVYNTPWHLTDSPRAIAGPSPRVGQHNGYVLGEILGLSDAEIASLERAGVLR